MVPTGRTRRTVVLLVAVERVAATQEKVTRWPADRGEVSMRRDLKTRPSASGDEVPRVTVGSSWRTSNLCTRTLEVLHELRASRYLRPRRERLAILGTRVRERGVEGVGRRRKVLGRVLGDWVHRLTLVEPLVVLLGRPCER